MARSRRMSWLKQTAYDKCWVCLVGDFDHPLYQCAYCTLQMHTSCIDYGLVSMLLPSPPFRPGNWGQYRVCLLCNRDGITNEL